MHLVFYIGLGIGLGVAAGLRPFLPALLAGALGSAGALGVGFAHSDYDFLQADWWLLAVVLALVTSYALQLRGGAQRFEAGPFAAAFAGVGVGVGVGVGALLFAGTLAHHGDASWPGLIGGAAAAALGQAVIRPLLGRARTRLPDRAAREALTLYVDAAALVLAALVALLHPLGYIALALLVWLFVAARRRAGEKYAGLRILGR
ncbi:MAG TPA: hypothetical protein VLJ42_06870 [Solirubrobacteraceae bacterium]|nr:hypothetical protein [Solirubrobacteraceae bacterium]